MKKINLVFICLFLFLSFSKSFAQEIIPLNENMEIKLNEKDSQQLNFVFDIGQLKFNSELNAQRYFAAISDNLTNYKVDFDSKKVTLKLLVKNLPTIWSIEDWNNYFLKKQSRYVSYYKGI